MEAIIFEQNFNNKFDCEYFTTFRFPDNKYINNKQLDCKLKTGKGLKIIRAEIVEIRVLTLDKINSYIAGIDAGMSVAEFITCIKRTYADRVRDFDTQIFYYILLKNLSISENSKS